MSHAEYLTVTDSDGAWEWEDTFSWYCASCTKELGVNPDERDGEVYECRFCGSHDLSCEHWHDEPQNRRPAEPDPDKTAAEFGKVASAVFGDAITDLWTLRTEYTVQSVIVADGVMIETPSVLFGAKWDAFIGMSSLAYRKIAAAYTHRGDTIPTSFVLRWHRETQAATLFEHDRITPESLRSLIEETL